MMEFSINYKDKPRSAFYVNELLSDAQRRCKVPETRIFDSSIQNYSKTIDPVTPLLKYDKEDIEVAGAALFSGDKFVGEIDSDQAMLLNALMDWKYLGEYIYRDNKFDENSKGIKRGVTLHLNHSKRKIEINTNGNVPVISIKLNLKATLVEYAGTLNIDKIENEKKLEEDVANSIKGDFLKLLEHLKDVGSDPVGFGEIVRSKHTEYWKEVNWKEVYKKAVFNMDVKMNLESYGTIR